MIKNKISKEDAISLISLCAIQVDEHIKTVELEKLVHMISLSPLFKNVKNPIEYLSTLNSTFFGNEVGVIMDNAIEALPQALRETAYAWACEIVMADSEISQEEHTYLNLLVKKMNIPGELARKISSVVSILNRK